MDHRTSHLFALMIALSKIIFHQSVWLVSHSFGEIASIRSIQFLCTFFFNSFPYLELAENLKQENIPGTTSNCKQRPNTSLKQFYTVNAKLALFWMQPRYIKCPTSARLNFKRWIEGTNNDGFIRKELWIPI